MFCHVVLLEIAACTCELSFTGGTSLALLSLKISHQTEQIPAEQKPFEGRVVHLRFFAVDLSGDGDSAFHGSPLSPKVIPRGNGPLLLLLFNDWRSGR